MGILETVELLLKNGFQPGCTIYLAFGHDEEVGGRRGAAEIAALLHSRNVELEFVLDEGLLITDGIMPNVSRPVALVGIAEKGYVSVELTAEGEGGHSSMPPRHTAVGILSTAIHKLEAKQRPTRLELPVQQMFDYVAPEMPFTMRMVFANRWLFSCHVYMCPQCGDTRLTHVNVAFVRPVENMLLMSGLMGYWTSFFL